MGIMCFGSSKQDDPEARKNAEIEKQLKADQKKQAREVKMLLLGMPSQPSHAHRRRSIMLTVDEQEPERVESRQCSSRCD